MKSRLFFILLCLFSNILGLCLISLIMYAVHLSKDGVAMGMVVFCCSCTSFVLIYNIYISFSLQCYKDYLNIILRSKLKKEILKKEIQKIKAQ